MIRRRLAAQDGFAVATAIIVLLVGLLFTTALITEAISTQDTVRRDGASKRAIQAARAGTDAAQWLMTATATTTGGSDPNKLCASSSGGVVSYSPVAADGWCSAVTLQLGARESVTYRVSAPDSSVPGETSRYIVASGTVPGNNGASVTRRVHDSIVAVAAPNVFDDYTVFSDRDLSLASNSLIGDPDGVHGNARSNGSITLASNSVICGVATAGPGGSVVTNGNSYVCDPPPLVADQPLTLDDPIAPTTDDDAAITTACGTPQPNCLTSSSWHDRELSITSNDSLTVTGNTFVLCSLQLSSNAQLTFVPLVPSEPIRIYIDSAANCPTTTQRTILLSSNTSLRPDPSSPFPLQLYVTGTASPAVNLASNTSALWALYAPLSDVVLESNTQVYGGIAARQITLQSNADIYPHPGGTGELETGAPPTYERGDFVECTSQPTAANPGSGC